MVSCFVHIKATASWFNSSDHSFTEWMGFWRELSAGVRGTSTLALTCYKLSLRPKLNCFSFLGLSISTYNWNDCPPSPLISFWVLESFSPCSTEFHGLTALWGLRCLPLSHLWLFWSPSCLFHLSIIPSRAPASSKPLLMAGGCHKNLEFPPKSIPHLIAE